MQEVCQVVFLKRKRNLNGPFSVGFQGISAQGRAAAVPATRRGCHCSGGLPWEKSRQFGWGWVKKWAKGARMPVSRCLSLWNQWGKRQFGSFYFFLA